jgi:hypothetical protein
MNGLPIGIIEGHSVHYIFVLFQRKKLCSTYCIPYFACSVITSCDESERIGIIIV